MTKKQHKILIVTSFAIAVLLYLGAFQFLQADQNSAFIISAVFATGFLGLGFFIWAGDKQSDFQTIAESEQPSAASIRNPEKVVPQVRPWVRFWARYFDIYLFSFLLFGLFLSPPSSLGDVFGSLIIFFAIMAPTEAILLSTWGTREVTPGRPIAAQGFMENNCTGIRSVRLESALPK